MNDLDNFQEEIRERSQQQMYESAVFGHLARLGFPLSSSDKEELEPLLQEANDRGIAPDRVAEMIRSSI